MGDLLSAISEFFTALLNALGFVGRTRQRANIRHDLELLRLLHEFDEFAPASVAHIFLVEHITVEVARFTGVFSHRKNWSTLWVAILLGLPLLYWAYTLYQDGHHLLFVVPGLVGSLAVLGGVGATFDPPKDDESESRIDERLRQLRSEIDRRDKVASDGLSAALPPSSEEAAS